MADACVPAGDPRTPLGAYAVATQLAALELDTTGAEHWRPTLVCFRDTSTALELHDTDKRNRKKGEQPLQQERANLNFRTVAGRAKVIEEATMPGGGAVGGVARSSSIQSPGPGSPHATIYAACSVTS